MRYKYLIINSGSLKEIWESESKASHVAKFKLESFIAPGNVYITVPRGQAKFANKHLLRLIIQGENWKERKSNYRYICIIYGYKLNLDNCCDLSILFV